jgi:undecaprenyl-diphosphatase
MTIFHAIILGIVEGLSEFLPISSTGHLILAGHLLGLPDGNFEKSFDIIIQLGAILAVVVLYWRALLVDRDTQKKVLAAFIPTGIIGLAFYKIVKTYLLGNIPLVVASLFVGGVFIVLFERWYAKKSKGELKNNISEITYKDAAIIGVCQSVAIVPGVSRSAATILGGLWLGVKRETIVEFSFLLAVPTMLAATGLDLIKNYSAFTSADLGILLAGLLSSFLVALAGIKFFLGFIKKYSFTAFGVYRIIVAVLFWGLLL